MVARSLSDGRVEILEIHIVEIHPCRIIMFGVMGYAGGGGTTRAGRLQRASTTIGRRALDGRREAVVLTRACARDGSHSTPGRLPLEAWSAG